MSTNNGAKKKFKVADDFLIDLWTSGLLNCLLDPNGDSPKDALQRAKIGYPVWSDEIYSDSKPPSCADSSSASQRNGGGSGAPATIMTAAYCGESVPTGLLMATPGNTTMTGEACEHDGPHPGTSQTNSQSSAASWGLDESTIIDEKRKRRSTQENKRMSATVSYS